jgi:hypothetical protein
MSVIQKKIRGNSSKILDLSIVTIVGAHILISRADSDSIAFGRACERAFQDKVHLEQTKLVGDAIGQISSLLDEGLITKDEFEHAKQGLVGQPASRGTEIVGLLRQLHSLEQSGVLTASEFSAVLGSDRAVDTLVLQKIAEPVEGSTNRLACLTNEMSPFDWGIRFEPVVKQILIAMWGVEILEVGRLVHPTDKQLAASPDGLIQTAAERDRVGRLIEIKCPVKREINGKIPFEYWCQMQIQMEVADIDECDYVEMKLASSYKGSEYVRPAEGTIGYSYNNSVWVFQSPDTGELKYAYTTLERKDWENLGWECVEVAPWHLEKMFTETVQRDRAWFKSTEGVREAFWNKVAGAKAGTFVPSQPKSRTPVVNVCKIMDD